MASGCDSNGLLSDTIDFIRRLLEYASASNLSTGSIHCCCETFELLDFHEAPSSNTNSFITLFIMLFYATSYLNYCSVIIPPSIVITVLGVP